MVIITLVKQKTRVIILSRRLNAFIAIAFILFMLAAVAATFFSCERSDSASAENVTQPATEQTTKYRTYVVREYDGVVAVFYSDSSKPIKVTQRYVKALPEKDRANLKEGIQVNDKEELRKLLEDLCS